MKKYSKLRFFIAMICFVSAFSIRAKASGELLDIRVTGNLDYTKAQEVLVIVNEERRNLGLSELQMDYELMESAMTRAMELGLFFEHTRPNGTNFNTISSKAFTENIAAGYKTARETMIQWMGSEGHRASILNPNYTSIGIGVFKNDSNYYWVQIFGTSGVSQVTNKTGDIDIEKNISVLKDNISVYARKYKNGDYYGEFYEGDTGFFDYGVDGGFSSISGVASDYTFTSSNSKVISIDNEGSFKAVSKGNATIKICLKADQTMCYSETITVKNRGDLNKDGKVDLTDILIELKIYFKNMLPDSYQYKVGDMNNDGFLDLTDILLLLKVYFRNN